MSTRRLSSKAATASWPASKATVSWSTKATGPRVLSRIWALGALSWVLLGGSLPAARGDVLAVLPTQGSSALTPRLNQKVAQKLAEYPDLTVLGPAEVAVRLGQQAEVQDALTAARNHLAAARKASLFMNRKTAVKRSTRAITVLAQVHARFFAQRQWAEAQTELGLALLLRPADEAGALRAFAKAVQADPSFHIHADRQTPAASRLWAASQAESVQTEDPQPKTAVQLARTTQSSHLLWSQVDDDTDGTVHVSVHVFDDQGHALTRYQVKGITPEQAPERVARICAEALGRRLSPLAQPSSGGSAVAGNVEDSSGSAVTDRWWFWPAMGTGALVLGGLTAGLVWGLSQEDAPAEGYDLTVRLDTN